MGMATSSETQSCQPFLNREQRKARRNYPQAVGVKAAIQVFTENPLDLVDFSEWAARKHYFWLVGRVMGIA